MGRIKAVALDVDGVLTDGSFAWGSGGEEFKRFSFRDVMGISLARKAGIQFALISGEATPLVDRFAQKMGIADVYKGCKDKATALRDFAARRNLDLAEVCFMGDDVNDLTALATAGWAVAPGDAHAKAKQAAHYVTQAGGGRGAVRELLDRILESDGGTTTTEKA
jgi:3-deoxy-D-manno-octulosonate 8-phosphate phosphatase (KDO 8-P phosphatase)